MSVGRRISTGLRHGTALIVAFLFTIPLVFMVAGSLRPTGPPPQTLELIPDQLDFSNFAKTFELVDLPRYALNSLLVVVVAVPLTMLVASWAGFAMARLQGRAATV